jgi:hypothetical protein
MKKSGRITGIVSKELIITGMVLTVQELIKENPI